ncbi:DinB family protein [Flavobacterium aquariorum]|uniref:DinB family protein n=1 Tax=Flavobacterium aquariorum TaxID=2217670 RepID=A0A2W7TN69_9FLAO|nr:DinB family protein [Flavobacterium aquariorum]PZX91893.1 DinB family protein [Flavobacterium aquariorum]
MLIPSINNSLDELIGLLSQLSEEEYSEPCFELSGSSIGEHTRHIVEMFQCLNRNYDSGIVNYDKRERNVLIETNTDFAIQMILDVKNGISKDNKNIELQQIIDGNVVHIQSNYYRELLYNLEHCIHHQALIKVAILKCENIAVDDNFGVARSTIEYRKQCAQ